VFGKKRCRILQANISNKFMGQYCKFKAGYSLSVCEKKVNYNALNIVNCLPTVA